MSPTHITFRICVTCYRQKSAVWPRKLISSKNNPKNGLFRRPRIWVQLVIPLKSFGYNTSNKLYGRSMASKLSEQDTDGLFRLVATEICEHLHNLRKRSVPENFQQEFF